MAFTKSILKLDFQLPKPPASSDATALSYAARFNLSPVNMPGLMHDRSFQRLPPAGQSPADPSEEIGISDSSNDDLPSVRKIIARSKPINNLTLDGDDDSAGDKNTIETASNLPTYSPHAPSSSLQRSPAHAADDHTTSSAAVTSAGKKFPWKNVPSWSPMYHRKLQLHSATSLDNPTVDTLHADSDSQGSTEPESPPNKLTDPTDSIINANDSERAHLEIAESSEQSLALTTASASCLSNVGKDNLATVDISKLTTVKVLDKRSSSLGVEYKCELAPLWLAADLVEGGRMGRVRIRSYENGLVRDRRLKTLRVGKRKFSEM